MRGARLGERVLVHCRHGIGRSALLALCVLVARGEAPLAALERAKRVRQAISPSPAQLEAFIAFARDIEAGRGAASEVPSLRELGLVAWCHRLHERDGVSAKEAAASSTRAE